MEFKSFKAHPSSLRSTIVISEDNSVYVPKSDYGTAPSDSFLKAPFPKDYPVFPMNKGTCLFSLFFMKATSL